MPSSITLTVHSLPRSTSFFLAALQPLDYKFRGRAGNNTVGFGSESDPSRPPDFWLTQEVPGVPASAAHVAFPASSHREVQRFFIAAVKAGGQVHGEPATRDNSGYYSAAVIDFDGNSIEAVHRPIYSDDKENVSGKRIGSKAGSHVSRATAARSVVPTTAVIPSKATRTKSFREHDQGRTIDGDILDNILDEVRFVADTARRAMKNFGSSQSAMKSESAVRTNEIKEGGAVTGTLLGVATGAALAFAFTTDGGSRRPRQTRSKTLPLDRSTSVYDGARRSSLPSGRIYEIEEIEYGSGSHRGRRNSVSGVSSDRHSSHSRRSGSHSRYEPIRMIEDTPRKASSRSSSRNRYTGSEASTIKPSRHTPASPGGRSGRDKFYPPNAFPASHAVSPSAVSSARKHPLPPSRPATVYTPTRERSRSRSNEYYDSKSLPRPQASRRGSGNGYTVYDADDPRYRRNTIMDREIKPEDSISQISVGSRNSRSSRR